MARATHVKAAQRDYPETECGIKGGIKKGQSYYWWKFKRGGKRFSLTAPKRSQLTQSSFYATLWDIEDRMGEATADDSLPGNRDTFAEELRALAEECESSLGNMPEGLQQGPTGEMLQERIDACNSAADELDQIDMDEFEDEDFETPDQEEGESDEDYRERCEREEAEHKEGAAQREQEYWESKLEELQAVSVSV